MAESHEIPLTFGHVMVQNLVTLWFKSQLGHIHPDSADKILRAAFLELGIEGASTHSFRRTCLTKMHMSGVPLKVIQKISGHKTLGALQKYLDVLDEDLESAVSTLTF